MAYPTTRLYFHIVIAMLLSLNCQIGNTAPDKEILVGQIVDLSGPGAANGLALSQGAAAYLAWYNSKIGSDGAKIRLITQDNKLSGDETVRAIEDIGSDSNLVAIVNLHGTAGVKATIDSHVLERLKIPVIGALTASSALHSAGNEYLYFIRADMVVEVAAMLRQATLIGYRRFAVVYQKDGYGQDALQQVQRQLEMAKGTLVGSFGFEAGSPDCKAAANELKASGAQVVLHFGLGPSVGICIEALRHAGVVAQHMVASGASASSIVAGAGLDKARGIGVVQVIPNPQASNLPITREYKRLMREFGPPGAEPSSFSLEGFIAAKVLVAAIKQTAPPISRASMAKSLSSLKSLDLGGYEIDFSRSKRGARYVAIGIISHDGRLAQ